MSVKCFECNGGGTVVVDPVPGESRIHFKSCILCNRKGYVVAADIPFVPWKIDLKNALSNSADNFRVKLFQLIMKGDPPNKTILKQAYPMESLVHEVWYATEDEEDFFKK